MLETLCRPNWTGREPGNIGGIYEDTHSEAHIAAAVAEPAQRTDAARCRFGGKGEDLTAKDTLIHRETQLSTNVFWSEAYSDLRTENLITYTPNQAVTPIVTYGDVLTDRSSVADMAAALEAEGYRVVAGINGDFYNVNTGLPIGLVVTDGVLRSSDARVLCYRLPRRWHRDFGKALYPCFR